MINGWYRNKTAQHQGSVEHEWQQSARMTFTIPQGQEKSLSQLLHQHCSAIFRIMLPNGPRDKEIQFKRGTARI
jgi:hypothetical protein